MAAFFTWTSVLALVFSLAAHMRARVLIANGLLLAVYVFLLRLRRYLWVDVLRDWVPQAAMILAYKEMGWFAPSSHSFELERLWITWDRLLLNDWHLRAAVEALGPVLPALAEICYSLVYAVPPAAMLVIYSQGQRHKADTLLTMYILGLVLCYAQFPFWPSEPPRSVFPGEDVPRVHTVFRDFNLWLVGSYGIHTSVFPSAHVSGAFAASMAISHIVKRRPAIIVAWFTYATLVAVATVYGRYHYAVDAAAGAAIGLAAGPPGIWLTYARGLRSDTNEILRSSR